MALQLILIRGLPGSGKSTMAESMMKDVPGLMWTETDKYFIDSNGEYKFDPQELQDAHAWCQELTEDNLAKGLSTVVSNTFSRKWEMQPYFDMAKAHNAELVILEATGNWKSVHNVPQHTIDAMKKRWESVGV
jgi:predicted kinase